jgi:hypothetical protein
MAESLTQAAVLQALRGIPGSRPPDERAKKSTQEQVWGQLKTCYDPEISVNIVDLGLVYACELTPLPDGSQRVSVRFTRPRGFQSPTRAGLLRGEEDADQAPLRGLGQRNRYGCFREGRLLRGPQHVPAPEGDR